MEFLIIFLPFFGFLFCSYFHMNFKLANYLPSVFLLLCCLLSFYIFFNAFVLNQNPFYELSSWVTSGTFDIKWSFNFDFLTSIMMIVVTTSSLIIHIYSGKYIENNQLKPMFMGYLSFSTFSMLILITANNLLQFFLGWQLVGFASFLLIGHLNKKIAFNKAAVKLFIFNKLSDFCIIFALVIIYTIFDTVSFDIIFEMVPVFKYYNLNIFNISINGVEFAAYLIGFAAIIRSAQLFFYLWSSESFEISIPALTLLFSSTLAPSGIFILLKFAPFIEYAPSSLFSLTIIGSITIVFLTLMALKQFNIKRIIIYSSCSQLSLIIISISISAYNIAFFHFINFSFFNALLILSVGSIIRSLGYKNDIRKMGGLYSKLPITFILFYIGCFSMSGIPFFSSFYSKDIIVSLLFMSESFVSLIALTSICFSSLIITFIFWRMIILIFHGNFKGEPNQLNKVKEPSSLIIISLLLLSLFSVFFGWLFHDFFIGYNWKIFWKNSLFIMSTSDFLKNLNAVPAWVKLLPIVLTIIGIGLALVLIIIIPNISSLLLHKFTLSYLITFKKHFLSKYIYLLFLNPLKLILNFLLPFSKILIVRNIIASKNKDVKKKIKIFFFEIKQLHFKCFLLIIVLLFLVLFYFFNKYSFYI